MYEAASAESVITILVICEELLFKYFEYSWFA